MAVASDVFRALGAYLKAQVQNAFIVIALYIVGFAVAGVPWWLLTGILCGILQLIPYLGSVIALGVGLLLKGVVASDWTQLLYVFGVWLVIQIADGFILSPRAAGRAGVHPFLAILITIAAGLLFGPLGIMFAVPVVAILLVIARAARTRGANQVSRG